MDAPHSGRSEGRQQATYNVDGVDAVRELADAPPPSSGAPLPCLVADELRLLLAYVVAEADPAWDGTTTQGVAPDTDDLLIAIADFDGVHAHLFGAPNDEALHGHPLASRGLRPYAVQVVSSSSWIRRLEEMNSVHPHHSAAYFAGLQHFVFTFHDTTFECVARRVTFARHRGSMRRVLALMAERLTPEET